MKKVLIITYYWPPMGGGGVQRWLKTTKYLRGFEWEPVIFTAEGAEVSLHDNSLLFDIPDGLEVIKSPIWEPFDLYKRFMGKKDEKINPGFLQKKKEIAFWKASLFGLEVTFLFQMQRSFGINHQFVFLQTI